MPKSKQNSYSAKDITVLEGLEAVRKRPGMYIGTTGPDGLQHLIHEVVDNSVDEAMAGHCDTVEVTLNSDKSVTVRDNGRGIPVDIVRATGKSGVETVMTTLHAGGKFENKSYQVSGGLHGVGASVVNALSESLSVKVKRDGKLFQQSYSRGKVLSDLEEIEDTDKSINQTGTEITFLPDQEIFGDLSYDYKKITERFREMTYLNQSLCIIFKSELHKELWPNNRITFNFNGGVQSFVRSLNRKRNPVHENVIIIQGSADPYSNKSNKGVKKDSAPVKVEIALQYNETFQENVLSFANCIVTPEGGTHLTGFRRALTRVINTYGKKNGLLKDDLPDVSGEDVREGLMAVISVKLQDPQFEGQTKGKLGNPEVETAVTTVMGKQLSEFLEDNPNDARSILDKSATAARAREAAKKARDLVLRKSAMEGGSLPGKLADCSEKNPSLCELFIVEGESAGGTAKQGRDRLYQAILPLRGKILNTIKARVDKVLVHTEIEALIRATGCGIRAGFEDEYDQTKLRYHKVVIMTDADVDGAHIRTLLLTFFFRYIPSLIDDGHLFIAQPPLYKVIRGKSSQWLFTEEDKDRWMAQKVYGKLTVKSSSNNSPSLSGANLGSFIGKLRDLITSLDALETIEIPQKTVFTLLNDSSFQNLDFLPEKPLIEIEDSQPSLFDSNSSEESSIQEIEEDIEPVEVEEIPEKTFDVDGFTLTSDIYNHPTLNRARRAYKDIKPIFGEGDFNIMKNSETVEKSVNWKSLPEILEKHADNTGVTIQRYKGLGEMNADQLWDTTMDPKRRMMLQVTTEDAERAEDLFTTLMGDEVLPRRNFIRTHALEANIDM